MRLFPVQHSNLCLSRHSAWTEMIFWRQTPSAVDLSQETLQSNLINVNDIVSIGQLPGRKTKNGGSDEAASNDGQPGEGVKRLKVGIHVEIVWGILDKELFGGSVQGDSIIHDLTSHQCYVQCSNHWIIFLNRRLWLHINVSLPTSTWSLINWLTMPFQDPFGFLAPYFPSGGCRTLDVKLRMSWNNS